MARHPVGEEVAVLRVSGQRDLQIDTLDIRYYYIDANRYYV